MKNIGHMKFILLTVVFFLSACDNSNNAKATPKSQDSQLSGKALFDKNCASCHGVGAAGLAGDWQKPMPDGKYPAPPLNGTAHAWHHPPSVLLSTINNGGAKVGGWMPAFKDTLSNDEKLSLLEYIFSLWPKEIQDKYNARFN